MHYLFPKQEPDPNMLTPSYLIKQASRQAVDTVCVLFNQTVAALLEANTLYIDVSMHKAYFENIVI